MNFEKVAKYLLCGGMFLCVLNIHGLETRQAHMMAFSLLAIGTWSLVLKNTWLILLIWWCLFLYAFYKFNLGQIYISNIIAGSLIYYVSRLYLKPEHKKLVINTFLWVVCANIIYSILQVNCYDFIYQRAESLKLAIGIVNAPIGFFSNTSITSVLYAMALPIMASRSKLGWLLWIPILILKSTSGMLAALVASMFILYFKMPKKLFYALIVLLLVAACLYVMFWDVTGKERFDLWKQVLGASYTKCVTGYGLDSFRNFTKDKNFIFVMGNKQFAQWDNAHNLYIQMFFEMGIVGLLLFCGYVSTLFRRFLNSFRTPEVLGLFGMIIAVLMASLGQFPLYLARFMVIIIPLVALYENITEAA